MSAKSKKAAEPKIYQVGTLVYTQRALLVTLSWMLIGDFCLQIMEELPSALVPLQLRWADASDAMIGFLAGSLPAFLGMLLNPFVGVQSDRCRSKLGRRRPFLLWATPVVVSALVGLAFAAPVSAALAEAFNAKSSSAVTVGWIGACMIVFVIANTYIMQVYQFLFVDVVPMEVMGRFVGCYRAVGALGAFVFHRYMFGQAETKMTEIYLLAALLYAASFLLLVWKVKEGEYPPPPPRAASGLAHVKTYFRECFGHVFYWKVFSISLFFWSALVPLWTFMVFFGTKPGDAASGYSPTLGLSLESFGQARGWFALISVPVFFLVGPLVDRYHPLRISMIGMFLCVVTFAGLYFFAIDEKSFVFLLILNGVAQAVYKGSYLAVMPRLLPREKYGQFFTANQIFGFSGVVLAPVLCGWLISGMRDYRLIFAWCGISTLLAFVMSVSVYRQWRALGGEKSFVPPGS
jgi:maltose/moltooligosaccharide transporter